MTVDIGRIYDNKDNTDAIRILVDKSGQEVFRKELLT